jgi:hypothetical protein
MWTHRNFTGQQDRYRVNAIIRSGERSTPIDLRGERRRITAIEFIYRSLGLSTRKTKLCVDGLQVSRAGAGAGAGAEDDDLEAE